MLSKYIWNVPPVFSPDGVAHGYVTADAVTWNKNTICAKIIERSNIFLIEKKLEDLLLFKGGDKSRRRIWKYERIILDNHWSILEASISYPEWQRTLWRIRPIIGAEIIQIIHLRIGQITIIDNYRTNCRYLLRSTNSIFWYKESLEIELIGWDIERPRGNIRNDIPKTILLSWENRSFSIEESINCFHFIGNNNVSSVAIIILECHNSTSNAITIWSNVILCIKNYVMPNYKYSSLSLCCWPNGICYIKSVISIFLHQKRKWRIHISKSSIINISRKNSKILMNRIHDVCMFRGSKNISDILIRHIKNTRTSNISDNGNFSNKVNTQSSCRDSWLRSTRDRSNLREKWNPSKSTTPSKPLNKCRVRIIIRSSICRSDIRSWKYYPSSILTPDTSMNRTDLIWVLQYIWRTYYLRTATYIAMIKGCPSNISKPEISWQKSIFINGCRISTIGYPNIEHDFSWMSSGPCCIRNKCSMNPIQSTRRKRSHYRENNERKYGKWEKVFTFHENWISSWQESIARSLIKYSVSREKKSFRKQKISYCITSVHLCIYLISKSLASR